MVRVCFVSCAPPGGGYHFTCRRSHAVQLSASQDAAESLLVVISSCIVLHNKGEKIKNFYLLMTH
jgi:hypothetical protein